MLLLFQNIYKYFFESFMIVSNAFKSHPSLLSLPSSSQTPPPLLLPSYPLLFSFKSTELNLCCSHTHEYKTIHWNMNSLLGLYYWEKFDSPSMSSNHLPIALQLCLLSASVIHAGVFDSVMYRICLGIHGFCDYMCTMILPLTADRQSPSITSHLHVI